MNNKNKYNPSFVKPINKKNLDQLAARFNLSEEELLMIEKVSNNPLEIMKNKSALEKMKKTADKVFKGMSKEDKVAFEQFKKFNEKELIENKEKLEKTIFNDNSFDMESTNDLNIKENPSKKEEKNKS